MFANVVIDWFNKGGPIMWPILLVAIVAICVVGERAIWWIRQSLRRDPEKLEKVLAALENADFPEASRIARDSTDPVLRMIWHGLNHIHSSLQGALQVAAGVELRMAGRFLTVMDTLVTLAPLLGLLGTVTGIMRSFGTLGDREVNVAAVSGGIGEALIATACGLGIAIISLVPYNYFTSKTTKLQFELETAATNIEVMVNAVKQRNATGK